MKCEEIGLLCGGKWAKAIDCTRRVYSPDGAAPTITTCGGGQREVKIMEECGLYTDATEAFYRGPLPGVSRTIRAIKHDAGVIYDEPIIGAMRGRNPDNPTSREVGLPTEQQLEIKPDGTSNAITTVQKDNLVVYRRRVRKLTQRECWRLMDFGDVDFDRAAFALNKTFYKGKDRSGSQLYRQAGNSIVVAVLEAIFGAMTEPEEEVAG